MYILARCAEARKPRPAEVTGTAWLPRVRGQAEPNVPEEDKLSWLMFGYGAERRRRGGPAEAAWRRAEAFAGGAASRALGGKAGKGRSISVS
ncbi:hypothetical protein ACTMU2_38795 [Cupriavidus basilensis]